MRANLFVLVFPALAGCFLIPTYPNIGAVAAPSAAAYAAAAGNPTRHTAEELDAFLTKNLAGYSPVGAAITGKLEEPVRVPLSLKRGACYMMVLRLKEGAAYSSTSEAGLRFDYEPVAGGSQISGGPGVHGPGGAGSAGCPQSTADYTFVLRTMVGASESGLGSGPYTLQLYSKPISDAELAAIAADQERQIQEAKEFKEREAAKKAARAAEGCGACAARYEGCRGAGGSYSYCSDKFRSCAFERVGPDYPSACQSPRP